MRTLDLSQPQPVVMYFELIEVIKNHLRLRYPNKTITTELDGVTMAILVMGIGEHGMVRYGLDYANHEIKDLYSSDS